MSALSGRKIGSGKEKIQLGPRLRSQDGLTKVA